MKLRGRLAVVTGGTDGIGREIARHLQAGGAQVIVLGRDEARLSPPLARRIMLNY